MWFADGIAQCPELTKIYLRTIDVSEIEVIKLFSSLLAVSARWLPSAGLSLVVVDPAQAQEVAVNPARIPRSSTILS